MHIVVNHLRLGSPVPGSALRALEEEALPRCREIPGFVGAHLVRVDDEHHIMVVLGADEETLTQVSSGPGGQWVREHLVPLMVGPSERHVRQVLTA
ncbi:MAG: hypothetical protein AB7J32_21885 [Pseudonocardia sp.]